MTAEPASNGAAPDYGNPDPEWLRIEWKDHLRSVEAGGVRVNYVELGPARKTKQPPIVFVHGLSGCWQNWLENMPHFAKRHRVVAMDLPGFGATPMPSWDIDIPAYGRFLEELLDTLGIERCFLVGNSMGGFVAAETAIQFPKRVEKLALVSAAGISQGQLRKRPLMAISRVLAAAVPANVEGARVSVSRDRVRRFSYGLIFRYPERLRPELLYEQTFNGVGRPGFLPALSTLLGYDFRDRLPEIGLPTLVVWGRNDMIVPATDADEFERLIPNSAKVILEKTGHVPQMERPAQFNRCLEAFLAGKMDDELLSRGPTHVNRPRGLRLVETTLAGRRVGARA